LFRPILYIFAKALELIGILTMPWALWYGMSRGDMSHELMLLGLGVVVFLMGRELERFVAQGQ
jgi:hypothetical protein